MMKIVILILFCLGVSPILHAQTTYQNVIAAAGGTALTKTMTLDWTLGEPVTESARTEKQWYTQGFQQPLLTVKEMQPIWHPYTTSRSEETEITVAPNPVSTMLTLTINNVQENEIEIQISNFAGQIVKSEKIDPKIQKTQLDLSPLATGLYILRVYNTERQILNVFKITKFQ